MRPNVIVKIDENKPIRNGTTTVLTSRTCTIVDFDLYITDFDEINNDLRDRFIASFTTSTDTISSNYTAKANDILLVDTTSGPITITLPEASLNTNKEIFIKKVSIDTNYVTLTSADNIDDKPNIYLKQQWTTIGVISDGTSWKIIGTVLCYPL